MMTDVTAPEEGLGRGAEGCKVGERFESAGCETGGFASAGSLI